MGVGAGWYYDSLDGDVVHQNLAESLANAAFSYYHGPYKTAALAEAHAGVTGAPGQENEGLGTQLGNVTSTGILAGLTSRSLWVRIAEGVIGAGLIIIGVTALLRKPIGEAAKIGAAVK